MKKSVLNSTLKTRKEFSLKRLKLIETKINKIVELRKYKNLCIYITGSYGRHEATKYSDLDIFFISFGKNSTSPISRLSKTLIDAEFIKIAKAMGFPPFSKDGEFLQIHYLDDIKDHLGSRNDDFSNYFTARLLLLLESYPLYDETFYKKVIKGMISTYYRDFHDHVTDFLPIFLVNDIIRYWKTLCLNYEHSRHRQNPSKRLKTHVKNLKLVFSRKLTCFSLIIAIVSKYRSKKVLNEKTLLDIVCSTPIQRLEKVIIENPDVYDMVREILELYSWFIKINNQPEPRLLKWIAKKGNRDYAFLKGRKEFGGKIFTLLEKLTEESPELLKYLVI